MLTSSPRVIEKTVLDLGPIHGRDDDGRKKESIRPDSSDHPQAAHDTNVGTLYMHQPLFPNSIVYLPNAVVTLDLEP
ncbi:hypothetical protein R1flu_006584 [Riccia fluitans]|uniref:Uncharacterized protein n=1 Tax=Riccia fluitans TaxID=41844 RepID=A0ABD1YWF3_9MARC